MTADLLTRLPAATPAVCVTRADTGIVPMREIEIFDRVGGGDSLASGLIHGFLGDSEPSARPSSEWLAECWR